ncbi:MAG TPA: DUF4167 domain-containing protein [Vitreimonas sp.]|uniref:DUF4167 domain-containing protein n=1 Tax=Vitreimonas sp. TaxID=3069702 RepID=UPI002D348D19|nr:DUF4167 domain-containing protein [Vitreimonas sp.]HYD85852.1 DUF4167 domain-containing protein [Vitreimonas sp.]
MKRQRGRGRRPGGGGGGGGGHQHGNNPNRTMESSGPDTKVRGPAAHIHERYLQLARDAASSGDRVLSENYLQHADHYFRLVRQMQPAAPPPQADRFAGEQDFEGDEEGAHESETAERGEAVAAESGEQPDVDFPQGQQQQFDRGEGEGRRRRGRRNRFRPEGEREGGEGREGGDEQRAERRERGEGEFRRERSEEPREQREPREAREPRRERQPRQEREESGPEGFSHGPKPAFLRSGE